MRGIETSTVAMTAYNLLATASGARSLGELRAAVSAWAAKCRIEVPDSQFAEALRELVKRNFVFEPIPGQGLLDVRDQLRRPVIARSRDDEGQPNAGWNGWQIHARAVTAPPMIRLEDVVR